MKCPKEVVLKQGKEALIRPLEKSDEAMLTQFYREIPESDRWFMRYDVLDPRIIHKWIEGIDTGTVYSVIALSEGRIVGHASLHLRGHGCTRHIGRIRIMIVPEYRHLRLGTWMLLDIIKLAMDTGLEELRSDFVVGIEDAAIEAAHKLDFFERSELKNYVKDSCGNLHHMVIMTKRLHKNWGDF
ncbi:MAG: GNAT family N-acetyltransferase [Desulfatirhabdiaceae bacterium]